MSPQSRFKTVVRLLLLVVSSLCLTATVSAQRGNPNPDSGEAGTGGNNTIVGNVYFPSGQRVDRPIRVRLFTMTKGDMTTMTSDNGSFSFRRLAPGTYTVVIDGEKDYEPVSERVQIIQPLRSINAPEQVYPVQIKLTLKTTSEFRSGVVNSELANVPKRALSFYEKGLELAQAGNSKGAIEQLQRAVSEYSDFMLAFNELGVQYLRLGELKKAEEALRSALKIKPDAFAPVMNHGIALVRLNRFSEAEPELRNALKQKEQSAIGHYYLGRALAYLGRFDEAEKELTSAITLGGKELKEAHRYLAGVYNARGDRAHAIAELETYLRLSPTPEDAARVRQLIQQLRGSH